MIPFQVLPQARAELLHEIKYYSEIRPGTGVRLHAAIDQAVSRARAHRLGGAPAFNEARSILVKGFPFSVIYVVEEGTLVVVAVAPHRKRPLYWSVRAG